MSIKRLQRTGGEACYLMRATVAACRYAPRGGAVQLGLEGHHEIQGLASKSGAASVPALPGCWSQVATEEEALELDNRLGKDWRWLMNGYSRAKLTITAIAL